MLEVRVKHGVFVVFDVAADQPVMRFDNRRDANQLIAELQVQELHGVLERWSPDREQEAC